MWGWISPGGVGDSRGRRGSVVSWQMREEGSRRNIDRGRACQYLSVPVVPEIQVSHS